MGRDLFIINHKTAPEASWRFKVGGMVGALSSIPLTRGQEDERGQEFAHREVVALCLCSVINVWEIVYSLCLDFLVCKMG